MKSIGIVAILITMLVATSMSSSTPTVTSLSTTINIVAGNNTYRNITIENDASTTAQISYTTSITPDSNGINISYSIPSPYTIKGNEHLIIKMLIDTSLALKPGTYEITTNFYTETPPATPSRSVHYHWVAETPVPPINETTPPVDNTPEDNETIIPLILPNDTSNVDNPFWIVLLGIVIVISLLLSIAIVSKRNKRRKNK
jgi:hypothetical protein